MSKKQIAFIGKTITDKILGLLEKGIIPWKKPWKGRAGHNLGFSSKKPYKGFNSIITSCIALERGYKSPFWLTLNQVKKLGGFVNDIKKVGVPVTYWNFFRLVKCDSCSGSGCSECSETGKVRIRTKPWCRLYWVFNADEVTGLNKKVSSKLYPAEKEEERLDFNPIKEADNIWNGYKGKPELFHDQSDRAYYSPSNDEIHMNPREDFKSESGYYSTLFHEAGHSTGHKDRLNRDGITGMNFFGSHEYSKEELVAELTATILSGIAGIDDNTIENSASYIISWSRKLKDNPEWFVEASGKAQRAVDHILGVEYGD